MEEGDGMTLDARTIDTMLTDAGLADSFGGILPWSIVLDMAAHIRALVAEREELLGQRERAKELARGALACAGKWRERAQGRVAAE